MFAPGGGTFKTDLDGLNKLSAAERLIIVGETLQYVMYLQDYPVYPYTKLLGRYDVVRLC